MASDARARVLVVDDQLQMAEMLADGLQDAGFDAEAVDSGEQAAARLEADGIDVLVTDLRMAGLDGLELLATSRRLDPGRPVIVMTAYGAIDTAIESIRRGAYHYLTKPFKLDELVIFVHRALDERRVRREAAALRRALGERAPAGMVGRSVAMRRVFDMAARLADAPAPVLILGETGTGKGLLARALHAGSARATAPLVTVNCAALPEALLESELFGHVRGAFTGATAARNGLFVDADGGTLFLDEIGELALPLQAKLLDALERRVVRPVGSSRERTVDVRIVAATHRDLRQSVREGTFREDLYYRLDVVAIELPPLRQRTEDVPELVDHALAAARARYPHSPVRRVSREAMARLLDHDWPGNVRELLHVIERLVLLGRSEEVGVAELPLSLTTAGAARSGPTFAGEVIPVRELQRQYAGWALQRLGGNRSRTAERLGIDFKTLARWLASDGEDEPRP